jgi:hypothetical protein
MDVSVEHHRDYVISGWHEIDGFQAIAHLECATDLAPVEIIEHQSTFLGRCEEPFATRIGQFHFANAAQCEAAPHVEDSGY